MCQIIKHFPSSLYGSVFYRQNKCAFILHLIEILLPVKCKYCWTYFNEQVDSSEAMFWIIFMNSCYVWMSYFVWFVLVLFYCCIFQHVANQQKYTLSLSGIFISVFCLFNNRYVKLFLFYLNRIIYFLSTKPF